MLPLGSDEASCEKIAEVSAVSSAELCMALCPSWWRWVDNDRRTVPKQHRMLSYVHMAHKDIKPILILSNSRRCSFSVLVYVVHDKWYNIVFLMQNINSTYILFEGKNTPKPASGPRVKATRLCRLRPMLRMRASGTKSDRTEISCFQLVG